MLSRSKHLMLIPVIIIIISAVLIYSLAIIFISYVIIKPYDAQAAVSDFDSSLVAHYTFDDGTATDSSGQGNNGTLVNGPTTVVGQIGQALLFDGSDDYINAGSASSLNITSNQITMSAWIYWKGHGAESNDGILAKNASGGGYRLLVSSSNKLLMQLSGTGSSQVSSNTTISTNSWIHVVGLYDGANLQLYINGIKDSNVTARTANILTAVAELWIGHGDDQAYPASYRYPFNGYLDDVRIYNRALFASEISELYQYGLSGGDSSSSSTSVNGTCGSAAKSYIATESFPSGSYCSAGTASPSSPSDPSQGSSSTWSCVGGNNGTTASCTATRAQSSDTTAPSTPTNLTATTISSSQINLSWTASTDNTAVTGYKIYRNSTLLTTTSATSYSNTGLTANTTYNYTVSAYDAANNFSPQSSQVSATTQSTTGNRVDRLNSSGTIIASFTTIQACADVVQAGETCLVWPGMYDEYVTTKKNGVSGQIITFRASKDALIKGFQINNNYIRVKGFNVTNDEELRGIYIRGDYSEVIDNYVYNIKRYNAIGANEIDGTVPKNVLISGNRLFRNQLGIITSGDNWIVENNEIERPTRWIIENGVDADHIRIFGTNHTIQDNFLYGGNESDGQGAHMDCFQTFANNGRSASNILVTRNYCEAKDQIFMGESNSSNAVHDFTFKYNVFVSTPDSSKGGIDVQDIPNVSVINNTFIGQGILISWRDNYQAINSVIKNNLFYGDFLQYSYDILVEPYERDYNIAYFTNYIRPGLPRTPNPGPHDLVGTDPEFINVNNPLGPDGIPFTSDDGLRLQSDSPACGAGEDSVDIGAYACTGSSPTTPTCTSFTYSTWSSCSNSTQSRTVLASSPSGCTGGSPSLSQTCSSPDLTPPAVAITSPANNATISRSVSFSATASDPASPAGQATSGFAGLQFKLDNANLGPELTTPTTGQTYSGSWNTNGVANGTHTISAVARDLSGNRATSTITLTVANATADATPPNIPANLSVTPVSPNQINLFWSAAADPSKSGEERSGLRDYLIYRNNIFLASTTATSYSDTNLSPATLYTYAISSRDQALNESQKSGIVSTTIPSLPPPPNPPAPSHGSSSGTLPSGTRTVDLSLTTDLAATCRYATNPAVSFSDMSQFFAVTGSINHSAALSNLTDGRNYTYYVRCRSQAGLAMAGDYVISFFIASPSDSNGNNNGNGGGGGGTGGSFKPDVEQKPIATSTANLIKQSDLLPPGEEATAAKELTSLTSYPLYPARIPT